MRSVILFTALASTLYSCKSDTSASSISAKQEVRMPTSAQRALPSEGKRFDPPVTPESLPSGSYYCDMGTVHYAQPERGDQTCPICKMKLSLKR